MVPSKGEGTMNDYKFGNFLYELRSEKGLSQSQLGDLLGVTNKAVSKWENGSTKPNTDLIPQIAKIYDISVEELFAGKRFEKDSEYEKIKQYLSLQKQKYAILSSIFLAVVITLPLFLIEFICVVMGFHLRDDIAGPLGAFGFIIAFIVSITSFVIYRKNFKQTWTPSECIFSSRFIHIVKEGIFLSAFVWWCLFVLLFTIYLAILSFSSNYIPANIFLSIAAFILIVLFGAFICFANIKRLLKIKFSKQPQKEKKRIHFSELPVWAKICYIAFLILFPILLNIRIRSFLLNDGLFISIIGIVLTMIWFGCIFALIFYTRKKK